MKRITAILLTCLIVLHFAGFYFIFFIQSQHLEVKWENRFINNNFDQLDLKQMTLDISFPYLPDQDEFVMVNEEMNIDGHIYRIIKKRYHEGQLDIVYVNDHQKEQLNTAFMEWKDDIETKKTTSNKLAFSFNYVYEIHSELFQLRNDAQDIEHSTIYVNLFSSLKLDLEAPPPKHS